MTAFFVTATGTEIGKTYVTAGLVRGFRAQGLHASALKPVISGIDAANFAQSDSGALLDAMGQAVTAQNVALISPWRFAAPLSPDMAAAREGRKLDFEALVEFSRQAVAGHEGMLFIEGVGGVMVPLDETHTVLDWMKALDIPVVLVTGSYLGTISHTLSALDVVQRAGLTVAALLVNESESATVGLSDTVESLRRFMGPLPIAPIGRNQAEFGGIGALLGR